MNGSSRAECLRRRRGLLRSADGNQNMRRLSGFLGAAAFLRVPCMHSLRRLTCPDIAGKNEKRKFSIALPPFVCYHIKEIRTDGTAVKIEWALWRNPAKSNTTMAFTARYTRSTSRRTFRWNIFRNTNSARNRCGWICWSSSAAPPNSQTLSEVFSAPTTF